ncbi:hypothetical protein GCM10027294_20110 [Marinactinospora endophytica]
MEPGPDGLLLASICCLHCSPTSPWIAVRVARAADEVDGAAPPVGRVPGSGGATVQGRPGGRNGKKSRLRQKTNPAIGSYLVCPKRHSLG